MFAVSQLAADQRSLEAALLNLSLRLQNSSDTQSLLINTLTRTAATVSTAFTLIDQVSRDGWTFKMLQCTID